MAYNKKLFPIILLFLLTKFLSNQLAEAGQEKWKAIPGITREDRILYDPESVIPLGPGTFRVWIISFDKDHSPMRSLEEIDCSNMIYRYIELITEKPDKPIQHTFTTSEWRGIDRRSPRGELTRMLCK